MTDEPAAEAGDPRNESEVNAKALTAATEIALTLRLLDLANTLDMLSFIIFMSLLAQIPPVMYG